MTTPQHVSLASAVCLLMILITALKFFASSRDAFSMQIDQPVTPAQKPIKFWHPRRSVGAPKLANNFHDVIFYWAEFEESFKLDKYFYVNNFHNRKTRSSNFVGVSKHRYLLWVAQSKLRHADWCRTFIHASEACCCIYSVLNTNLMVFDRQVVKLPIIIISNDNFHITWQQKKKILHKVDRIIINHLQNQL